MTTQSTNTALSEMAEMLARARDDLGMSLKQLERSIADHGVMRTSKTSLSYYETGKRVMPRRLVGPLADVLHLDRERLESLHDAAVAGTDAVTDVQGDDSCIREPRPNPKRRLRLWSVVTAGVLLPVAALVVTLVIHYGGSKNSDVTTYTETTGTPAHTWSDYQQASGTAGTPLKPQESIQVICRAKGYVVPDHDPWWYKIASVPWNGRFWATSDAFYNNSSTSGPVDNGVIVDESVPIC